MVAITDDHDHDTSAPGSSSTAAPKPEDHEKSLTRAEAFEGIRTAINEEYSLMERCEEMEKEAKSRVSEEDTSSLERDVMLKKELARVFSHIEQVQKLGNLVGLARFGVTPYYYGNHLKPVMDRVKQGLAELEARKEHVEFELEKQVQDTRRRPSTPGTREDFDLMRHVKEPIPQMRDEPPNGSPLTGRRSQSPNGRAEETDKMYWLPENQFNKFIDSDRLIRGFEEQANEGLRLANELQARCLQLEQENDDLKAKRKHHGAETDPDRLVELVTLLLNQFIRALSTSPTLDTTSRRQRAIIRRLKELTGIFYPGQDLDDLVQFGQFYVHCLSPPSSPEPPFTTLQEVGAQEDIGDGKRSRSGQERKDFGIENELGIMSGMSKKEGKRAIRDSDMEDDGPSASRARNQHSSTPIDSTYMSENDSQIDMEGKFFVLRGAQLEHEATTPDADETANIPNRVSEPAKTPRQNGAKRNHESGKFESESQERDARGSLDNLKRTADKMGQRVGGGEMNTARHDRSRSCSPMKRACK
ncbi:MAG: hypothetical protein Q9157_000538 [Trypethelium eluteriae]